MAMHVYNCIAAEQAELGKIWPRLYNITYCLHAVKRAERSRPGDNSSVGGTRVPGYPSPVYCNKFRYPGYVRGIRRNSKPTGTSDLAVPGYVRNSEFRQTRGTRTRAPGYPGLSVTWT
eukprot:2467702-Rhodomonas_salina.4